jgi:Gpi18-like mannosyltransferase
MKLSDPIDFLAGKSDRSYQNYWYYLIAFSGFALAIFIRLNFIEVRSFDFQSFLELWYGFILENGKFWALKYDFSNYNPSYLYLMVLVSYLFPNLSSLYAIKLISITFDFISAFFVYKIVAVKYPTNRLPTLAAIVFLLTPTVFINSASWGQADGIYTSGLLASLYFILIQKNILALICFGLAFSVKQQAVFLSPLILLLALRRMIPWYTLLIVPSVYFLMLVPAWVAGRPLQELLLIYINQGNTYQKLTMSVPNLYQWISNDFYDIVVPLGLLFAAIVVLLFITRIYRSGVGFNPDLIIKIALLSCLLIPYCLPKMHDRYFYPADVLSVIFFFYSPKHWYVPILVVYTSLFCYMVFLLGIRMVSLPFLSLVMSGVIFTLVYQFHHQLLREQKSQALES